MSQWVRFTQTHFRNSELFSTKLPTSPYGTNLLATRKYRFISIFLTVHFKYTHSKLRLVAKSIIHSAVRLTTGPQPLPKPVLHTVRSSAYYSIYSILSYHSGHPIAAYVFFLVFPSPLSFPLSVLQWRVLAESSYARCYQSSQHNFLILQAIHFSSPWLYAIFVHFSHDRSSYSSQSFSITIFQNFPAISDLIMQPNVNTKWSLETSVVILDEKHKTWFTLITFISRLMHSNIQNLDVKIYVV
jgi:hypothetical protein